MSLSEHDMEVVRVMFDARIKERLDDHVRADAHHKPPCPYFANHRALIMWAVPAICGVAVFLFGVTQKQIAETAGSVKRQAEVVDQLRLDYVETRTDMVYIKSAVADIRDAVRSSKGYTAP